MAAMMMPHAGGWDPHVSPQFTRPTKVIHLRNLPFDVTVEEIKELCAPWGAVLAVKDKVGGQRNQAFVEFAALEAAIGIVSHYQSSPEPAKLRGRPTWLSYSGRDKLTNLAPSTDTPTPVLRASINNMPPDVAPAVNLDLLGMAFGAHGYVKKMVTHVKSDGGLLAWVQFSDATVAGQVKASMQGQPLPRHLLNDHPHPPVLELSFAAQSDLAVTTQSQHTRDYTNAALPWGEPDWGMIQSLLPAAVEGAASNVLSVSFDKQTYPVTVDGVHTIFSTYGFVEKIHIFERDGSTVALVQYPDQNIANTARTALEGHAMYDGGHNVMHLVYSKHRSLTIRPGERSRDYTAAAQQPVQQQPPKLLPPPQQQQQHQATQQQQPMYGAQTAPPPAAAAPPHGVPAAPGMQGRPAPPPPGPGMPPAPGSQPLQQQQQQVPPPYGAPMQPPPMVDPNFTVTGEDFVRQHERVLEQYGGRTSGRGAAAPYAAAAATPYGGYAVTAAAAVPAYAAAAPGGAAYGSYQPPVAAYLPAPPPAPGYGAAAAYGAAPAAGYGVAAPAAGGYYQPPPPPGNPPPPPPAGQQQQQQQQYATPAAAPQLGYGMQPGMQYQGYSY